MPFSSRGDEPIDLLLAQVGHLQHISVRRGIEALGLYRGQPQMLSALWEQEGLTHSELAAKMHVQPATVSKMVQRMERSGFVERRRDPTDERISRVFLTERGRAVRNEVEAWFHEFEAAYTEGLSDEDKAALRRLLLHIRGRLVARYGGDEEWPDAPCDDEEDEQRHRGQGRHHDHEERIDSHA